MSMTTLTIIQMTVTFLVYTILTCGVPFWLLNKRLQGFRLSAKLLLSYVFGNFYIINLVFVLQLLHISNRFTLLLGTVLPLLFVKIKLDQRDSLTHIKNALKDIRKVFFKEIGVKSLLIKVGKGLLTHTLYFLKKCFRVIKRNPLDTVLFFAFVALTAVMYGTSSIHNFGYYASDIPIHNYWINYMGKGEMFVGGVYPYGFHCMLYYLHAVFGIPTYVLLRVFGFVQAMYIHLTLLLMLKACLKSRYTAYAAMGFYVSANIFTGNTFLRFFNALPQEFGMIFIMPAVFFGFAFFRFRKKELMQEKALLKEQILPEVEKGAEKKTRKQKRQERKEQRKNSGEKRKLTLSTWCLFGFAMSFGLTLAVHFYDTIFAGLFCVAMAIAFCFRFFNKNYFGKVIITVVVSVLIAVLPLAIGLASGIRMEGSLKWAQSMLAQSDESAEVSYTAEESDAEMNREDSLGELEDKTEELGKTDDLSGEVQQAEEAAPTIKEKLLSVAETIDDAIHSQAIAKRLDVIRYSMYISPILLVIFALVFFITKKADYGAQLLTVGLYMTMLAVLLASQDLGLPELVEKTRKSVYFAYALPLLWGFTADAILVILLGWIRKPRILNLASLAVIGLAAGFIIRQDLVKTPVVRTPLETNEAITCLTNIIHENKNWTWTICSANDELRMGEDYGYHFETIELLREMEYKGKYAQITIPTPYVYFFIEKIPLDYAGEYEGSGQSISEEGAKRELPNAGGLGVYLLENRWIVMSRMYYWAEALREMFPHEMQVYFESDQFICYRLEQNPANLIDLGINYGYNNSYDFWAGAEDSSTDESIADSTPETTDEPTTIPAIELEAQPTIQPTDGSMTEPTQ